MCTAIDYHSQCHYFGRTLDYDFSYGESIVILPRNYALPLHHGGMLNEHHALMGVAHVARNYPLFYDGINEKGLAMAGLNFTGNAVYSEECVEKRNIAHFELTPYVLASCGNVQEAVSCLQSMNLTNASFSEDLPSAQLHWMICDSHACVVVEYTREGMKIYHNPSGVLTNNPPFPLQSFNLNNYVQLSSKDPENHFSPQIQPKIYSRGMGGLGLPGDLSSQSRFVRAAFTKLNATRESDEVSAVNQVFHILGAVSQTRGCCTLPDGNEECTIYTNCYNCTKGYLYYTCYEKHEITAINMHNEDLNGKEPIFYAMQKRDSIRFEN